MSHSEEMRQGRRSLIVGASGQVGTQMLELLGAKALPTSRAERPGWIALDLARLETVQSAAALLEAAANPQDLEAIYCVGAITHVDGCETEPDLAYATNARGPGILAAYARERHLPFVFFSTEYVFDGRPGSTGIDAAPYGEEARTHPLSVYGSSKLEGERRVLEACPEALILRTTVVYGPDPRRVNYIYSLMKNLRAGQTMRVPEDQISTPTYSRDLIHAALGLVEAGASGVFHVCGPERMGRLEFAQRVAAALGLDTSLLQGVSTAELNQVAPRPLAAGLATEKLRRLYPHLRMRTLDESLEDCGAELRGFLMEQQIG